MILRCKLALLLLSVHITVGQAKKAVDIVEWTFAGENADFDFPHTLTIASSLTLDPAGKFYTHGKSYMNSYQMYFEWFRRTYGGIMINGSLHRIEIVLIDDSSNATTVGRTTDHFIDKM